jgi:phosphatidylinositol alpha 1,6-mannosyltransferase
VARQFVGDLLSWDRSEHLDATTFLCKQAKILYAPNPKLYLLLEQRTGWSCHLMQCQVDTDIFTPSKPTCPANDGRIVLGFVGRLSIKNNIALLLKIDVEFLEQGNTMEWLIVGYRSEEKRLQWNLSESATFTGALHGDALAVAYANMDLLFFPCIQTHLAMWF